MQLYIHMLESCEIGMNYNKISHIVSYKPHHTMTDWATPSTLICFLHTSIMQPDIHFVTGKPSHIHVLSRVRIDFHQKECNFVNCRYIFSGHYCEKKTSMYIRLDQGKSEVGMTQTTRGWTPHRPLQNVIKRSYVSHLFYTSLHVATTPIINIQYIFKMNVIFGCCRMPT